MSKAYEVKGAVNPEIFYAHLNSSTELISCLAQNQSLLWRSESFTILKATNFQHLCTYVAIEQ